MHSTMRIQSSNTIPDYYGRKKKNRLVKRKKLSFAKTFIGLLQDPVMVRNKLCCTQITCDAVELLKQRKVGLDW